VQTSHVVSSSIAALMLAAGSLLRLDAAPAQSSGAGGPEAVTVTVDWNKTIRTSKTTPTLQVVVNPPLRRGSRIHDRAFESLRALGCDYVRYVPWLPYPRLGVAELEPPANGKTSWDFSLIDPMTADFMEATAGHSVMMNFSTIPQWMFKTDKPVSYPADPDTPIWNYSQGTELRDPTGREVGDYYARLVSWYTKGGFTDEVGVRHESGHKYKFDYWEVLNEPDLEHNTTAEQYTARYDAIVSAIHAVAPDVKFVGMSLAFPSGAPRFFEYFLDPKNHKPDIPLDMISYHFYAVPTMDQGHEVQPFTFFEQADRFLAVAGYIETIRQRLSPATKTTVNEIGSISAEDLRQGEPGYQFTDLPNSYWNLSGAVYAYVYAGLARAGIDVAGESQLVGYPTQFPSVSMLDWTTGAPNARYQVLKLLKDNFAPGDTLIDGGNDPSGGSAYVHSQAFVTRSGERKLLLINKRDRPFVVTLPADATAVSLVDQTTRGDPPASRPGSGNKLTLPGLAVAVITLSHQAS
jgi:hypothetical protein